jgi:hypothetical protein
MDPRITWQRRIERGLPPLYDDWRNLPYPIPDRIIRYQLVFEISRATQELIELEERIKSENRSHGDLHTT